MLGVLASRNKTNAGYLNDHLRTPPFSPLRVCIVDTKQHTNNKSAAATNDEDIAQKERPNSSFTTVIWIGKGKGHPYTGTEALYRPYGP